MRFKYILAFILTSGIFGNAFSQKPIARIISESLSFSVNQYIRMADNLANKPGLLPRTIKNDTLVTSKRDWWTSGFFPGSLWYLYEYSGNERVKQMAKEFTARVEKEKFTTNNHDVGFMIYCSFGNAYRLTKKEEYRDVILTAAKSLSTRYRQTTGVIRSWDWGKWQYPVIIDNMMNLELLFFASRTPGYESLKKIAESHADITMANHFRPDGSCFHVVSYDTITGKPLTKQTRQGYSDASSWARGQAWALYGYTMAYRESGNPKYLAHAKKIAGFILNHPRLPEDKIPYWDFDDPAIPNTLRDASAGAIICSALIELSKYADKGDRKKYLAVAEQQIRTLSSPEYRAEPGANCNFILKHSVGSKPEKSEVDVPLTYADYYFIEAMMRWRKIVGSRQK